MAHNAFIEAQLISTLAASWLVGIKRSTFMEVPKQKFPSEASKAEAPGMVRLLSLSPLSVECLTGQHVGP